MAAVVCVLAGVAYVVAVAASAPNLGSLTPVDQGQSSVLYAADGSPLGYVQSDDFRIPVSYDQMSPDLRNATVATEDEHFYQHKGVDYTGILRAAVADLTTGQSEQGASTITQQLVKQLYLPQENHTLAFKIREAKLALDVENHHTKEWILNSYLNTVPYGTNGGRTAIGVEAAAQTYFSKPAKDLTLEQSALLAGLPQAPSVYNPITDPSAAITRRNQVLNDMARNRMISPGQAAESSQTPLDLHPSTAVSHRREPYFFDYVQDQMIQRYGADAYRRGGLKVYTTVDPRLQQAGRQAIQKQLGRPGDPQAALVSVDPTSGAIKAMATNTDYNTTPFNLVTQGQRQPGSTFKAMVLATAINQGVDPNQTFYISKPLDLNPPGFGPWHVTTFDNNYGGRMNLAKATLISDNTVYAQLDLDLGPQNVANTARAMGITSPLSGTPAEGLGGLTQGVTPLELASAYATLADGGIRRNPTAITRVVFPDGHTDDLSQPTGQRAFSDGVATGVTQILQQDLASGTAKPANIGCPDAAKTGTTSDFKDAWLTGYSPHLSTAVWMGYSNGRPMQAVHGVTQVTGSTFPAGIWHDYMEQAQGSRCEQFPPPQNQTQLAPFNGQHTAPAPQPPAPGPLPPEALPTPAQPPGANPYEAPPLPPNATTPYSPNPGSQGNQDNPSSP